MFGEYSKFRSILPSHYLFCFIILAFYRYLLIKTIYMHTYMCVYICLCCSCLDPMDCSPPGFPVHRISQARILVPFPSPGNLPDPGICLLLGRQILYHWATWEALICLWIYINIYNYSYIPSNLPNCVIERVPFLVCYKNWEVLPWSIIVLLKTYVSWRQLSISKIICTVN